MAKTPSTQRLPLGKTVPGFVLPDPSDKVFHLEDFTVRGPAVVLFACNHCPYVLHISKSVGQCAGDFAGRGVGFVAINSNDASQYPEDHPSRMDEFSRAWGWNFPYLVDADQRVAKAWQAACTPDFFLVDSGRKLRYAGQFDASRPGNHSPTDGRDLRTALEALLGGRAIPSPQKPSLGCNIKWKPGNEPA
ncbi:MAG: thioredoxin family protein [Verrucomicrobia bacterium]|nr:thioredoxin family protein [Verrucomicrobiota bacterium]